METAFAIKLYNLSEKECDSEVSYSHLNEISCFCCKSWESLFSHLDITVVTASDCKNSGEDAEKILDLLSTWKKKEGSNASYKKLIDAFLSVGSEENAGKICKLLLPASVPKSSDTTGETVRTKASTEGM